MTDEKMQLLENLNQDSSFHEVDENVEYLGSFKKASGKLCDYYRMTADPCGICFYIERNAQPTERN